MRRHYSCKNKNKIHAHKLSVVRLRFWLATMLRAFPKKFWKRYLSRFSPQKPRNRHRNQSFAKLAAFYGGSIGCNSEPGKQCSAGLVKTGKEFIKNPLYVESFIFIRTADFLPGCDVPCEHSSLLQWQSIQDEQAT